MGSQRGLRFMSLSGPELDLCKQRCLRRMQAWHRLTMTTLTAEFPDFDLCNAFCICSLPDPEAVDGGQPLHSFSMAVRSSHNHSTWTQTLCGMSSFDIDS